MHPRLLHILAIMLLALPMPLAAQEAVWSVDESALLNNREGGGDDSPDKTVIFTRLAVEGGISMLDDAHVLKGGAVWYQPMIDNMAGCKVLPILYYRYNDASRGWHVAMGMMPRTLMVRRMPRYLWSDSLNYVQPNLRGGMVQYIKPNGYAELAIDWRQMQTDSRREAFNAMLNADWRVAGPLWLGGHVQYNHLARTRHATPDQHVNDDLVINPMAALDLSWRTALDSLRIAAGAIVALERNRGDNRWHRPAGLVATATARWRWLQVDETFYSGKGLMPLRDANGCLFNLGDPYYSNNTYSRTDVSAHLVNNRFVDLSVGIMYHASNDKSGFWQQLSCRFFIDSSLWKRRRDKSFLKNGHLQPLY